MIVTMPNATLTFDVDSVLQKLAQLERHIKILSCIAAEAQTNKARRHRMLKRTKFVPAESTDDRVLDTFDITAYVLQAPLLDEIKDIRNTMGINDSGSNHTAAHDGTPKNCVSSDSSLFANP